MNTAASQHQEKWGWLNGNDSNDSELTLKMTACGDKAKLIKGLHTCRYGFQGYYTQSVWWMLSLTRHDMTSLQAYEYESSEQISKISACIYVYMTCLWRVHYLGTSGNLLEKRSQSQNNHQSNPQWIVSTHSTRDHNLDSSCQWNIWFYREVSIKWTELSITMLSQWVWTEKKPLKPRNFHTWWDGVSWTDQQ